MVRVNLNEWLDYWKFDPYPFASTEAESEAIYWPERLAERLVKPRCFDRVLGQASDPKTVVVFAPRGAGKTACRILLDYYCREGIGQGDRAASEAGGQVLPVPHTRLYEVIRLAGGEIAQVNEHLHVVEILRRAVKSLTKLLIENEEMVQRIPELSKWKRFDLEWFFHVYLTPSAEELAFMREKMDFFKAVRIVERSGRLGFVKEEISPGEDEFPQAVLRLWKARLEASVIDQLQLFIELVGEIGFQAVYVLVDGLDELEQTADDPFSGVALLSPLMANLKLMNTTPRLAFKFFLPEEMRPFILEVSHKIRPDRLTFETVTWSEEDLLEILHRRLGVCCNFTIQSLDAISVPELRGRVERELVQRAQGNPRRLFLLADLLVQIHCERDFAPASLSQNQEMKYLLNEEDLNDLLARLPQEPVTRLGYGFQSPLLIPVRAEHADKDPLTETICQDFPGPIALVYLDYLQRQEPLEKFRRLLDLFEVTVCFVGVLLLSQLRALAGDQTPAKLHSATLRLQEASLGLWLVIWERLPGLCANLGKSSYIPKLQRLFARQHERLIAFSELRNEFAHGALHQDEQSYIRAVKLYDPQIHTLLSDLRFLSGVQLVKVKTLKKQKEGFIHQARLYKGDNPNFPWTKIALDFPLECNRVFVLQDSYALSLHPFVIVAACPDCGGDEEIFFYQKLDDDFLIYLSFYKNHRLFISQYTDELKQIIGS